MRAIGLLAGLGGCGVSVEIAQSQYVPRRVIDDDPATDLKLTVDME